jgi:hypothetical protein
MLRCTGERLYGSTVHSDNQCSGSESGSTGSKVFSGLPDPDPLVRGMDPALDPDPDPSIIMQKIIRNLESFYFVTLFDSLFFEKLCKYTFKK